MFTGIIETTLKVESLVINNDGARLTLQRYWKDIVAGESIAVAGVCLTLVPDDSDALCFDLSPETLQLTRMADLKSGDNCNVERALKLNDRMGGHYVSGHVDDTAQVKAIQAVGEYVELQLCNFSMDEAALYLLKKASLTVDGVSLTINEVDTVSNTVSLMLVPHTLSITTLGSLIPGDQVNIEFDYLTRIVAHQLRTAGSLKNEV